MIAQIIFLGLFYMVLLVVTVTMVIALKRSMTPHRAEAVRWHADFEDLPERARICRHEHRSCENGFDCRKCEEHAKFAAPEPAGSTVAGFQLHADRLYHRGHTWVRPESDGTVTIGLDGLAALLLDRADIGWPQPGTRLVTNGTAFEAMKNGVRVRVLSPVDGEVLGVAGNELRVRPDNHDLRHLLNATEARPWLLREAERLQLSVSGALADGGLPVDDIPPQSAENVYGLMFLNP